MSFDFVAMKSMALNMAVSALVGIGIGFGIQMLIKGFDALVTTQEELEQAAKDATQEYENTKSSIEKINTELDGNNKRIDELKRKGSLTYVEQGELDKLQKSNEMLETQLRLKEMQLKDDALEAAKATGETLNKYIGTEAKGNSTEDYKVNFATGKYNEEHVSDTNLGAQLAIYQKYSDIMSKTASTTEEYEKANDKASEAQSKVVNGMSDIITSLNDMQGGYDLVMKKISQSGEDSLTSTEDRIKNTYESYSQMYDSLSKQYSPSDHNASKFDEIFQTEGLEKTKEELIEMARAASSLNDIDFTGMDNLVNAIENADFALKDGEDNISSFKGELFSLVDTVDGVDLSFEMADGMDDTIDCFDRMSDQLSQLADLQDALGSSFRLSADEARAFAEVYPEILSMGAVTADGLIQMNADQVNAFISGKEAEIQADGTSRITELENAKAVLEAKKEETQAKLDLALGVANGEVDLNAKSAEAVADGQKKLTDYLISLGLTESQSSAAVAAAMAGNMEEYSRITGEQAGDVSWNLASALSSAATNSSKNAQAMIDNIFNIGKQAASTASSIAAMNNGNVKEPSKYGAGAAGTIASTFKKVLSGGKFNAAVTPTTNSIEDFTAPAIEAYQLDISKYTEAIANIDKQIALLQAGNNTPLDKFSSGKYNDNKGGSSGGGNKGSGGKAEKEEKKFSETFDWIAIAIDSLQDKITSLGNTASSVYKTWSQRNEALGGEITAVVDKLQLQQKTYAAYMDKANSVSLSDHYKTLVREGAISIETITDENLAKSISEYQKWYKTALEELNGIQDSEEELGDLMSDKFDNIASEFDNKLQTIDFTISMINKSMDIAEAKGMLGSKLYYDSLMKLTETSIENLNKERDALLKAFTEGVDSGAIAEYSEKWYELQGKINDVDSAIADANLSLAEFNKEMKESEWEVFDYLQDSISQISEESDFLIKLLSNKKLYDKNGQLTDEGNATLALNGVKYNTFMEQSNQYGKSIKELDEQYKDDSLNKDYLARRLELVQLQREMITNAEDEKNAIADLIRDGYEAQLDSLQKIIDLRQEMLDKEKEQYEYEKEIASKTKNIAQIEKQLSSYSGDNSEESKKSIQELKTELQEAKDDLEETEYQKYLADQEAILQSLYDEFEQWINERMDNLDAIINDVIDNVNSSAQDISDTINSATKDVGYTISDSMKTIFDTSLGGVSNVLSKYDENFSGRMTTLQSAIDAIKTGVELMSRKAAEEAKKAEEEAKAKEEASKPKPTPPPSTDDSKPDNNTPSNPPQPSNNGASANSSIFVPKKSVYPKSKLKKYDSIVDALKFYDFDSSFAQRANYFGKLGGSGTYTGSSSQNIWMLSKFRQIQGYNTGGIVGNVKRVMSGNGDDTMTINTLQKGEGIIPLPMMGEWDVLIKSLPYLNNVIKGNGSTSELSVDNVNIEFILPDVENYEQFVGKLKNDDKFSRYILSEVHSSLTGSNSLNKNKYR